MTPNTRSDIPREPRPKRTDCPLSTRNTHKLEVENNAKVISTTTRLVMLRSGLPFTLNTERESVRKFPSNYLERTPLVIDVGHVGNPIQDLTHLGGRKNHRLSEQFRQTDFLPLRARRRPNAMPSPTSILYKSSAQPICFLIMLTRYYLTLCKNCPKLAVLHPGLLPRNHRAIVLPFSAPKCTSASPQLRPLRLVCSPHPSVP